VIHGTGKPWSIGVDQATGMGRTLIFALHFQPYDRDSATHSTRFILNTLCNSIYLARSSFYSLYIHDILLEPMPALEGSIYDLTLSNLRSFE
jgi:hypothetical protein